MTDNPNRQTNHCAGKPCYPTLCLSNLVNVCDIQSFQNFVFTCTLEPDMLVDGVSIVLFLKPVSNLEKCKRLIRLCARPLEQLKLQILNDHPKTQHLYIYSKETNSRIHVPLYRSKGHLICNY